MERVRTSLFFIAVLVVGLWGICGVATAFSGAGSGTENAPYIITTIEQLQEMNDDLAACYELDCDIDASATQTLNGGAGFKPIGNDANSFTGTFDGRGHVITGLYIDRPSDGRVGLFGRISEGAEIMNVELANVNISGYYMVGALVGENYVSTVSKCEVIGGNVTGSFARVGGLVGNNTNAGAVLSQCYSDVSVAGGQMAGGLVGAQRFGAIIYDSYARGDVSSSAYKIGGLVGDNMDGHLGTLIKRCYSSGKVTGTGGGLIGYNWQGGVTQDSYWDVQASGKSSSYGGTGKTTAQMMQQATFINWDFDGIWEIDEGQSYPYFSEPRVLVALEIVGPNEVAENFRASYKAIAHYDNNSTRNVTDSALWSVEPNTAANIDGNGILTTQDIDKHRSAIILASYTEEDVTFEAEKAIDILAICPIGTALQFDGVDDYVDVGDPVDGSLDFGAGDSFSIAAWIKISENATILIKRRVVGGTYYEGYLLRVGRDYSSVYLAIEDTGSLGSLVVGETPLVDNEWHHVVAVRDTGEDKLYVYADGVSVATPVTDTTTATLATTQEFWIGRTPYYNYFFNGTIDEVSIYNRALSAEEIRVNMHTRLTGEEPGLVGYWDFDEGEGQIAYDLSPYGNHGQLGSTPNPDDSDPAWVDSDAPIGICSLYQSATMATERAVGRKLAMLEELLVALAEEWTAYEALEELLESGDYGDLNKGDIVTAKQKIHSATQHEEQAIDALTKSIEKLKDALSALGYELEPTPPPPQ